MMPQRPESLYGSFYKQNIKNLQKAKPQPRSASKYWHRALPPIQSHAPVDVVADHVPGRDGVAVLERAEQRLVEVAPSLGIGFGDGRLGTGLC